MTNKEFKALKAHMLMLGWTRDFTKFTNSNYRQQLVKEYTRPGATYKSAAGNTHTRPSVTKKIVATFSEARNGDGTVRRGHWRVKMSHIDGNTGKFAAPIHKAFEKIERAEQIAEKWAEGGPRDT